MTRRTITDVVAGRQFYDAVGYNGRLYIVTCCGRMAVCAWGDQGPELVEERGTLLDSQTMLQGRFDYVRGKIIAGILTDGEFMRIRFRDGHELQINHHAREPVDECVHVRVMLPAPPPLFAAANPTL